MSGSLLVSLVAVSLSQVLASPCGQVDFAVATPERLYIGLEHGGALVYPQDARPWMLLCAGHLVDHLEVGRRILVLDSQAGPAWLEEKPVLEPIAWIQGGVRLLPGQEQNRVWVVCPEFLYQVSLTTGQVELLVSPQQLQLKSPLAAVLELQEALLVVTAEGQAGLYQRVTTGRQIQWKKLAWHQGLGKVLDAKHLDGQLWLATSSGLFRLGADLSEKRLLARRVAPGPVDQLAMLEEGLVLRRGKQLFWLTQELLESKAASDQALQPLELPGAKLHQVDGVRSTRTVLAAWDEHTVQRWQREQGRWKLLGTRELLPPTSPTLLYDGHTFVAQAKVLSITWENGTNSRLQAGFSVEHLLPGRDGVWLCGKTQAQFFDLQQKTLATKLKLPLPPAARPCLCDHWLVVPDGQGNLHLLDVRTRQSRHQLSPDGGWRFQGCIALDGTSVAAVAAKGSRQKVVVFRVPEGEVLGSVELPELGTSAVLDSLPSQGTPPVPWHAPLLGKAAGCWWLLAADGTLWLKPKQQPWQKLDGGVCHVSQRGTRLFLAKGRYGVRVLDLRRGPLYYAGGWSSKWFEPVLVETATLGPGGFMAYQPGGTRIVLLNKQTPSLEFTLPQLRDKEQVKILDQGMDIFSQRYANARGYTQPLRPLFRSARDPRPVPNGFVLVDRSTGTVRFSAGQRAAPQVVGECFLPHPGNVVALMEGRYLFVGGGEGRNLEWWDLSRPTAPQFLQRTQPAVGPPVGLAVKGHKLFLIANIWGTGLYIYQLQGEQLHLLGKNTKLGQRVSAMHLWQDHVYVLSYRPKKMLYVVDVQDPRQPRIVAAKEYPLLAGMVGDGGKLFLCLQREGGVTLQALDLNDPRNPRPLAAVELSGSFGQVAASGSLVAVTTTHKENGKARGAVSVFRLQADKASWQPLGTFVAPESGWRFLTAVEVQQQTIYFGATSPQQAVLHVLDAASGKLRQTAQIPLGNGADHECIVERIQAQGGLLFVLIPQRGIRVFDLAQHAQPRLLTVLPAAEGWGGHVDVHRHVAYIDDEGGPYFAITTVDVSDPRHPKLVARQIPEGTSRPCHLLAAGQTLLAISNGAPVASLDLNSDPFRPRLLGRLELGGSGPASSRGLVLLSEHQVLAAPLYWGGRWGIVDFANPRKLRTVAQVPAGSTTLGVANWKDRVIWIGSPGGKVRTEFAIGLKLYDISRLEQPRELAQWFFFNQRPNAEVAARDGFLFVWFDKTRVGWGTPGWWAGRKAKGRLMVFDIRDPHRVRVVADYPAPPITGVLADMCIHGHYLYLLSYMEWRLMVLDISRPDAPVEVVNWQRPHSQFWYPGGIDIDGQWGYITGADLFSTVRLPLAPQAPQGPLSLAP